MNEGTSDSIERTTQGKMYNCWPINIKLDGQLMTPVQRIKPQDWLIC